MVMDMPTMPMSMEDSNSTMTMEMQVRTRHRAYARVIVISAVNVAIVDSKKACGVKVSLGVFLLVMSFMAPTHRCTSTLAVP